MSKESKTLKNAHQRRQYELGESEELPMHIDIERENLCLWTVDTK